MRQCPSWKNFAMQESLGPIRTKTIAWLDLRFISRSGMLEFHHAESGLSKTRKTVPTSSIDHAIPLPRLSINTTTHGTITYSRLFLVLLSRTLRLRRTSELLGSVLSLLALLSAGLLDLGCVSHPDESVVGFEFLHRLDTVVDEGETGRLPTTVLRPHAEDVDLVFVGFVHLGKSGAQVVLGDIGAVGMEDITVARNIMSVFPLPF